MFDRFTDRAKKVMTFSREEAVRFHHDYIGVEHMLLGLVKEGSGVAVNVLKNMGSDLDELRRDVEKIIAPGSPMVMRDQTLPFTARAKVALENAMNEATDLGHDYIGTEHLMLGLIRENEGIAAQVLVAEHGATLDAVRAEIAEFLGEPIPGDVTFQPEGLPATRRWVWTHWYRDGQRESEGSYVNGVRQDLWTFWKPDGSIDDDRTGVYEDGERTGPR